VRQRRRIRRFLHGVSGTIAVGVHARVKARAAEEFTIEQAAVTAAP